MHSANRTTRPRGPRGSVTTAPTPRASTTTPRDLTEWQLGEIVAVLVSEAERPEIRAALSDQAARR